MTQENPEAIANSSGALMRCANNEGIPIVKIDKAQARSMTEEYEATIEKQRYQRLKFLLEKTTVYAGFLAEKMTRQQEKHEGKGKEPVEKAAAAQDTKSIAETDKSRHTSQTDGSRSKSKRASSMATSSVKRRKEEIDYNIADYIDGAECQPAKDPANLGEFEQPKLITGGVLKSYQLEGVEWLISLYENGLNGILADEMGLGKTVQCISFLAFLREKGVWGPFLVAAPLSTLTNWVAEFQRFAPSIPVQLYHGSVVEREAIRRKHMSTLNSSFPIVITSYEIVMNDRRFLQRYKWKYLIVDEGHRLKNLNCKLIRELKTYDSANRLLLTGTPLHNNLSELWSLLNFLLPDIFDDLESFQNWFDLSELGGGNSAIADHEARSLIISNLHTILKPFLLRRLKSDVERGLPKKKEYLLYASMTSKQREYYQATLNRDLRSFLAGHLDEATEKPVEIRRSSSDAQIAPRRLREKKEITVLIEDDDEYFDYLEKQQDEIVNADDFVPSKEPTLVNLVDTKTGSLKLQNIIMQLRKVCNHPYLFGHPFDAKTGELIVDNNLIRSSGKMMLLDRLLPALLKQGHKVLIFSQMSRMLDLIGDYLSMRNFDYCRIDGSVGQAERVEQMHRFENNSDISVFLLTTRAGGLGINLVSADTVIFFDSDWNPQMDLQAQDRVHRIGQTRPVLIYRLVTANSVESKILERANSKRRLEKLVIHKAKFKGRSQLGSTHEDRLTLNDLAAIIELEEAENVPYNDEQRTLLSAADLEAIMDRSEAAFAVKNEPNHAAIRVVEEARHEVNDALADM